MAFVLQVRKKTATSDWQSFPEKEKATVDELKDYVNKQLSDVATGQGDLQVEVVKLVTK